MTKQAYSGLAVLNREVVLFSEVKKIGRVKIWELRFSFYCVLSSGSHLSKVLNCL